MHWSGDSTAHDSASISEHHDGVLYMQSQKKQQRHAIKNSNAPRDKCIYRAHFSPMWANHIGQTLIGSLHQPNVEFHKNNLSSTVVYSDRRTACGPCSNPRGSRIFFFVLWLVWRTCFQCRHVSLRGPDRVGSWWLTQTWRWHSWPTSQWRGPVGPGRYTRGNRSGSMTDCAHHRYEELVVQRFYNNIKYCSVMRVLLSS